MKWLTNLFRFHKIKILITFVLILVFSILLFPFNDLSDLVAARVAAATNNQVYVEFEKLTFNLGLNPGLKMQNVVVEGASIPTLNAESLVISPWLMGLLAFKKGVNLELGGFYKGSVDILYREGAEAKGGGRLQLVEFTASDMTLDFINDYFKTKGLDLGFLGQLNIDSQLTVDPSFQTQPNGTLNILLEDVAVTNPRMSVSTEGYGPTGPRTVQMEIELPPLKLEKIVVKANVKDGRIIIENFAMGEPSDELFAKISGDVSLPIRNIGGALTPELGNFDLKVDLTVTGALQKQMGTIIGALPGMSQAQKQVPGGVRYVFRAQPGVKPLEPKITPLTE